MLGGSFQIGRSALAAYQQAIAVAGQNIANVGNPDYTRQTGRLTALTGGPVLGGPAPGAGVELSSLRRHFDGALEQRLRGAISQRSGSQTVFETLRQVESLYGELSEQDLSTALSEMFTAFGQVQTEPTDMTSRQQVIATATSVIQAIQRQRGGLLSQINDLNRGAEEGARQAGQIADEIAALNGQIIEADSRVPGASSALRDRRDARLRDLAEMMDIQVREYANGTVNVYVNSDPLVDFDRSRGVKTVNELVDGLEIATVRFADNNGRLVMKSGTLGQTVIARDEHIKGQLDGLDNLARGMIYEVNKVHSTGRGLNGNGAMTGAYSVKSTTAALNSTAADLEFPVQNGSFLVHVRDTTTGIVTTRLITVDLDGLGAETSLSSLAASLSTVPGLTGGVTADGRLQVTPGAGREIWFTEDSSHALAALGVAGFFTGVDAGTLAINSSVRGDPRLIAAALTTATADGDNAGRLAAVADSVSTLLDGQTVLDFHGSLIGALAVTTASAQASYEAADAVHTSLIAQREAISGVSLDEEAINLTKFERAFQGASRYINVIQSLSDSLLSLAG